MNQPPTLLVGSGRPCRCAIEIHGMTPSPESIAGGRRVLLAGLVASAWLAMTAPGLAEVAVVTSREASAVELQAAAELADFLGKIYPNESFSRAEQLPRSGRAVWLGVAQDPAIASRLGDEKPAGAEAYLVTSNRSGGLELGIIAGADARGVVYGVYGLLRKLGCGFQISGDALPNPATGPFSFADWRLADRPLVGDRLVFDWHNFLSGCSTWNLSDWKAWILQAQKQGYNGVMVHAYGNNPMAEFTFNGKAKPVGYLSTTTRGRDWSTVHVNDVRNLWGGGVFAKPVFGADAAMGPDGRQAADARRLMSGVFGYAGERGMNVLFAVDVDTISANPQELIMTLPEAARFAVDNGTIWLANPDTPEGYAYYKAQVAEWLAAYPQITCLTAWFRLVPVGATPWLTMKDGEMPAAWQEEYRAALAGAPEAAAFWRPHNMFAIGKIVRAFARALDELGHARVGLAAGSWNFDFMAAADLFMPRQVRFIGLDYDVIDNDPVLATAKKRAALAAVGAHREVIPVIWAQHDDGMYMGRPYTPLADFASLLADAEAGGFGIIHWTTRPLDLFFSSHARQVWQSTSDEDLRATCDEMALTGFGPSAREVMGEYLERWVTGAPMFGRDTTDYFIDRPLTHIDQVVAGCGERLKLLGRVDPASLAPEPRERLGYFRGMEEFVAAFHRTQGRFQAAEGLWKAGDTAGASAELAGCEPEKVIVQFAEAASRGGITRGELGLVVSLNTRWLPHQVRLRQALALEPVRYNFGPTSHDRLAQLEGKLTYHFDGNHGIWQTLGKEETGAETFVLPPGTTITRDPGLPEAYEGICRSGIESATPLAIQLGPIFKPAALLPGDYLVRLIMLDPTSTAAGQRVIAVAPGGPAHVDVFKEAGGTNRIFECVHPIKVGGDGKAAVTLSPVRGKVVVSGIVLENVGK